MTMTAGELYEAVATSLLPDLPTAEGCDNAYDWMERLPGTGWRAIGGTVDGLLGDWPYQAVVFHNDRERSLYGIGVYTEGDISVEGFRTQAARDTAARAYLQTDEEA